MYPAHLEGVIGEARFSIIAMENGLICAKPPDKCRFDYITEFNGVMKKVQVKYKTSGNIHLSTTARWNGARLRYSPDDVDVFAILSKALWYIIPFEDVADKYSITVHPHNEYGKYINNWEALKQPKHDKAGSNLQNHDLPRDYRQEFAPDI